MIKLLRPAFMSLVEHIVQPLTLLAATTMLVSILGTEKFGLFTLVWTLTAMSPLLSLGTSALMLREVSRRILDTGLVTVQNAPREALSVLLPMSALATLATSIYFLIQERLVGSGVGAQPPFIFVMAVGMGCAVLQEIDTLYSGFMKGMSRFGWSASIEVSGRLVWLVSVVLGAQFGNLEGALLVSLIALLVKAVAKGLLCTYLAGTPLVFLPSGDIRAIHILLRRSSWLWVQSLGGILLFSIDRLIVGSLFGATVMGRYVACSQVATVALMIPAAAGQALVPWFSKHSVDNSAPVSGWKVTLLKMAIACAIPGLLIAASSHFILSLWLGSTTADSYWSVLAALAIGSAAVAATVPFHYGLLSAGATRTIALTNLAGGLASTLLCITLSIYGLTAFSFGKLAYSVPLAFLPYFLFVYLTSRTPIIISVSR